MDCYDVAIIGLGPAGATLARLLSEKLRVIALDKKRASGSEGFQKPCGGLLAPDAQRAFIRFGLNLPTSVIANPQIFSVKTLDTQTGITCNYQRSYININRHAFDLWMKSLVPERVEVHHDTLCKRLERTDEGYHVTFVEDGEEKRIHARYLVGADGANSMVRRYLYPRHEIRRYQAIQQWFEDKHPVPFYSCLFDNDVTDCYAWSISKDGYFIFGGAFPMKEGRERYDMLKEKVELHRFTFGTALKSEKCTVLCPSGWRDFVCGKDDAFLIGEAAGFISASSLEGISYALDSAELLSRILNKGGTSLNPSYRKSTFRLRLKLLSKVFKARILTTPWLRKLIMKSRISHIEQASAR
ncbi:oxidoreductase [Leminorella grimontii]|uniref:Protein CbrA n=1 Tax=Leminorella grimontii TaxID=82981 RepID=A0AAV5N4T1_9GAMM|nr:FAD-binding protein [Leminorella grimontii]KFC92883.1 YidS family protein [Leminorella grimontii ATCC 33999 = DSM 5078]GKX56767.1 oxidoreductase [Leminorella grimontii]VFS62259.1 putative oxidoreductase [Leminorella grimontii]